MKVALITPWDNAWIPLFLTEIERRGHEFKLARTQEEAAGANVVIHGWSSGDSQPVPGARNVFYLRRYELFDGGMFRVDWNNVDALIVVNSWIKEVVERCFADNGVKVPVHLIYNAVDLDKWTYRPRDPNSKIGMACHVHPKKNLPLAIHILAMLPQDYELHIAGEIQDVCTAEYLMHMSEQVGRGVKLYGHIPREQLDEWWDDKGFCLSTSISEGNPNNVLEAMAKGIKPVVHNWPGAEDQFPDNIFGHLTTAAAQIGGSMYESAGYRDDVVRRFSTSNIAKAVDIALG